jgi:hypothetical protein
MYGRVDMMTPSACSPVLASSDVASRSKGHIPLDFLKVCQYSYRLVRPWVKIDIVTRKSKGQKLLPWKEEIRTNFSFRV